MWNEKEIGTDHHRFDRDENPGILPDDFWDMVCYRYFPVLSLTYIASVFGVALKMSPAGQGIIEHLFDDPYPYRMALMVALWVSVPAVFWIIIRTSVRYAGYAAIWYKGLAGIMIATGLLGYFLLPELAFGGGLQMFAVASIPVFFIQYLFFVRGGLPPRAAWPLTLAGLVFMIYGTFVV